MIYAISGAQGQGKSTILASLATLGYETIENKTARSILSRWEVSLSDIYKNLDMAMEFHQQILTDHLAVCEQHIHSENAVFVERSFADIFTYAMSILGPHNEYSPWLDKFEILCNAANDNLAKVFHLTGRNYIPSNDGVRSINKHFAAATDANIHRILTEFASNSNNLVLVDTPILNERVSRIVEVLKWQT